jgi:hypothetical protein
LAAGWAALVSIVATAPMAPPASANAGSSEPPDGCREALRLLLNVAGRIDIGIANGFLLAAQRRSNQTIITRTRGGRNFWVRILRDDFSSCFPHFHAFFAHPSHPAGISVLGSPLSAPLLRRPTALGK